PPKLRLSRTPQVEWGGTGSRWGPGRSTSPGPLLRGLVKDPVHDLNSGDRQYVYSGASCGIGKTASGPGSGNSRSPHASVDRPSPDGGVEAWEVASEGGNRPPA